MNAVEGVLHTVGRDGKHYDFKVKLNTRLMPTTKKPIGVWPKYEYMVTSLDPIIQGEYQFTVIELDDSYRVIEMFHNDFSHLRSKRIGYNMIKRIHKLLGKQVTSSTTNDLKKLDDPEFREPPATSIWLEMQVEGLADWCPDREVFYYPR